MIDHPYIILMQLLSDISNICGKDTCISAITDAITHAVTRAQIQKQSPGGVL